MAQIKYIKGVTMVETLAGFTLILIIIGLGWGVFLFTLKNDPAEKQDAIATIRYYHSRQNNYHNLSSWDTLNWHIEPTLEPITTTTHKITYAVYKADGQLFLRYGFIETYHEAHP